MFFPLPKPLGLKLLFLDLILAKYPNLGLVRKKERMLTARNVLQEKEKNIYIYFP